MCNSSDNRPAFQKALRLVNYLLKLANLHTKLVRDISEYERVLWLSEIPREQGCYTRAWGADEEHELDEWLEVQSWSEPQPPAVPSQCQEWIHKPDLWNKKDLPELQLEILRLVPNPNWREGSGEPKNVESSERLEDHPEVQCAWEEYIDQKWMPWVEEHNAWERVQKVYSALFAIHQTQIRLGEEYELMLGLGLLTWQTPSGHQVRRHLVVADAQLEFEANLRKFTLRSHCEGAKLRPELDMLDIIEQPTHAEEDAKKSLAAAEDDPWDKACVEGVLQALVHSIDPKGDYDGCLEARCIQHSVKPIVEYAPALILRKRSSRGLTETLKRIKEQLEIGEDIPEQFADLAEIPRYECGDLADGSGAVNALYDGEIFFPKPANDEQRRIVQIMRSTSGVLVQGPPGTGKSHTIANLICHLLATGQRVLITAKTPRALRVLEGLLPDELRPLCINLLGSGLEEQRSLESSVGGILREQGYWDEDRAKQQLAEIEQRVRSLREAKVELERRLRNIRESETHVQSVAEGTYNGTAARIAEAVERDRHKYDWFSDSVSPESNCPITVNDLQKVLEALRRFTPEKRRELGLTLVEELLSADEFESLVKKEESAIEEEKSASRGADECLADLLERNGPSHVELVRDELSALRRKRKDLLARPYAWMKDALSDVLGGTTGVWRELLRTTDDVISCIENNIAIADEARIEFPETFEVTSLYEGAKELIEHFEKGGRLGWGPFRPKKVKEWWPIIKAVKVDGRRCTTAEQFSRLALALNVRIQFEKAWRFWGGRSPTVPGPYSLQLANLKSLRDSVEDVLSCEEFIDRCRNAIKTCSGVDEPVWTDDSQLEKVLCSCRLALARIQRRRVVDDIQILEAQISQKIGSGGEHPVTTELLSAIRNRDVGRFKLCVTQTQDLVKQREFVRKVDNYIGKLRGIVPQFVRSLEQTCQEAHWGVRVEHIRDAWRWAQARCWIEEYIGQEDASSLAQRVKQIEDEINRAIAQLAAIHAWTFCFSRLEESHRRHMEAWQLSMRRLGKGKGKYAWRHRREAQKHLNECREAVPAWVMPLHRVWDTVHPAPGMFDVIIVDEASQCGFEALPLFYLAKTLLIVGDDKQISPDAVGLPRDAVHQLMEEFLHDFQFKSSFDVESSLFDHGKLRYGTRRITLREHFRCMPEIIRFSNELCYLDTPLIPLRQYGPNRLPPLEHVFVKGGYREGSNNRAINRPEADAIVNRISEMCTDSRYDGKTMGVVVLQGEAQAALIEDLLLRQIGAEEMERRRLVCGNPYSFQGDERDIIFLSLVAAPNERIGPLTKAADERRFNVAASRARDMMVLFHSVTRSELSSSCLRRKLLEFFEHSNPQQIAGIERDELERRAAQDNRSILSPPTPFDSWFEVDVALELVRKGFTVFPQYEVAGKRIDLVVEGGNARLAVECDGDHWHGVDRYEADMQRQRQLERCGWEFVRITESAFYANKTAALQTLWSALRERGIIPKTQFEVCSDSFDTNQERENIVARNSNNIVEVTKVVDESIASSVDSECDGKRSGRKAKEVKTVEIQQAILLVLRKCPRYSCTERSLTPRVLKELGVLTRGGPRVRFERRVMQALRQLEKEGTVLKYKAKNRRVKLVPKD